MVLSVVSAGKPAIRHLSSVCRMLSTAGRFSVAFSKAYATTTIPNLSSHQRFWERISVESDNAGLKVCIAGSPLKTSAGKPLVIPHTKPTVLAHLIAQEWRVLSNIKLKSHMVPLTSLASRSLDITPQEREEVTEKLLAYLDTDTLVILSPSKDCNGELRKAQTALYPHLIEDAHSVWKLPPNSIKTLDTEKTLFGNFQSPETKQSAREWIQTLDNWQFASLERATISSKSLIIAMNVVLNRRTVLELAMLSSLDVIHQTALWGEVEDTHDVDREDLHRLLGAAYITAISKN